MVWITPKTDWVSSDKINTYDFNRIVNNLLYLQSEIENIQSNSELPGEKAITDYPFASMLNDIENELERINRVTYNFNIGTKKTYTANGHPFDYNELNRIEGATLKIHNVYLSQLANGKHLSFTLGGTNIFDCPRGISIGSNEVMGNRLVFRLGEEKGGYLEDE